MTSSLATATLPTLKAAKQPLELTAEALAERIGLALLWTAATRRIVKRKPFIAASLP
jgi:hypothetical protein